MVRITIKCWHCGKQMPILVAHEPTFAFELAQFARDVGWIGTIDMRYHRCLVFCSTDHANAETTRKGYFRKHPKGQQPNSPTPAAL